MRNLDAHLKPNVPIPDTEVIYEDESFPVDSDDGLTSAFISDDPEFDRVFEATY